MTPGYREVVKLRRDGKAGINFMFVSARQNKAMKGCESSPKSERRSAATHPMSLAMGKALEVKTPPPQKEKINEARRCKTTHF